MIYVRRWVYAALSHLDSKGTSLGALAIVNPRKGWSLEVETEDVLAMAGGKSFSHFMMDFESYVTDATHITPTIQVAAHDRGEEVT